MAAAPVPPLVLEDPGDNPEHYEFLQGQWEKKRSVGRKEHSIMGRTLYEMIRPIARQIGCQVEQEWTILKDQRKIIPDVTVSHPATVIEDGYLVAPALLVVESLSRGQSLPSLVNKCTQDHHTMGTRYCWIIDVDGRVAYECHLGDREARRVRDLTVGEIFSISVEAVFASFDMAMDDRLWR